MIIYTVTLAPYVDGIFNNGFSRQFLAKTEGTDYGDGVYCNIRLRDSYVRWSNYRHKQSVILKMDYDENLLNRFLIFDGKLASQIYGECSIKKQVYSLFGEDADKVYRDFTYIMKAYPDTRQHFDGRTAGLLQVLLRPARRGDLMRALPPEDRGRKVRSEYEHLFKKHNIGGVIYTGGKDGLCLVAYDFSTCKPFEVSYDGGKTWKKKEFKGHTVDMHKQHGIKYENIDYPIQIETEDGILEFSRVRKKNGKFNYIIGEDGVELSPVDFDSATLIDPDESTFEFEINNDWYLGCPYGFFVDQVEVEMGQGHTWDELIEMTKNMNENLEQKFEEILESTMKEVFKNLFEGRNLLPEEDVIDEDKYGNTDYELPTIEQLSNSDEFITLYHITPKSSVDGIFKFGFDREYLAKNANAYGRGVYTTFNKYDSRQLIGPHYGDAMLQLKLIGGFDRFLIFDEKIARKYYGDKWEILDQLKTFLPASTAHELYNRCHRHSSSYAKVAGKYGIRGTIYNWGSFPAILVCDISSVIPFSVSYDRGNTFKTKITDDTIYRFMTSIDVDYHFGHNYPGGIEKSHPHDDEDDGPTGFARVRKHNGKFNFVNIKTGEELSPVDFDSVNIDSDVDNTDENGQTVNFFKFQFEIDGQWFYMGCPYGFFVDQVEAEMGQGHTWDELLEE